MRIKILVSSIIFFCYSFLSLSAQIGYQVALLNTATGKPRAGETVNVTIELTNKEGETFYLEKQTATSNDFGVLSLIIGNENTFKNADWTKIPFFIGVAVDGVVIGKTQILSVPIAEAAKGGAPAFPIEDLLGTWYGKIFGKPIDSLTFNADGTFRLSWGYDTVDYGNYFILGNLVFCLDKNSDSSWDGNILSNDFSVSMFKDKRFCGGYFNGLTK